MLQAHTLDAKVMMYSADSVEWCPIKEFHFLLACGTYQLMKGEQETSDKTTQTASRLGNINLYSVSTNGHLVPQQCLETPAILDMKWCHQTTSQNEPILAVANAEGAVAFFYLRKKSELFELVYGEIINCVEKKGTLALSIDWCPVSDSCLKLVLSDSNGSISILQLIEGTFKKVHSWNSHSHEAWIATFDNQDPNVVYSGGDDCKLVVYDLNQRCQTLSLKREHNAGITALSSWRKHNVLISGSYDEKLRLWDKRNWKVPMSEIDLGGGVWRVKCNPDLSKTLQNYLLVACMHAGFKLVNCTKVWEGGSMLESLTYADHDSLAYGCDWCYSQSQVITGSEESTDVRNLIASCSFYDNKLCLWDVK